MKSKIIKTEEENSVALDFIQRLMEIDPEKDSKEGMLLSLLADEIVLFEKHYSVSASHKSSANPPADEITSNLIREDQSK